jgi:hypothetical protein
LASNPKLAACAVLVELVAIETLSLERQIKRSQIIT